MAFICFKDDISDAWEVDEKLSCRFCQILDCETMANLTEDIDAVSMAVLIISLLGFIGLCVRFATNTQTVETHPESVSAKKDGDKTEWIIEYLSLKSGEDRIIV